MHTELSMRCFCRKALKLGSNPEGKAFKLEAIEETFAQQSSAATLDWAAGTMDDTCCHVNIHIDSSCIDGRIDAETDRRALITLRALPLGTR